MARAAKARGGPAPAFLPDPEVAAGETYVPPVAAAGPARPPPAVDPSPNFFLTAHPERWTVMDGQVIPLFGRMVLAPGVNRTEAELRRDGSISVKWGAARQQREDRGWTVIPHDAIPDHHVRPGQPRSYVWRPAGRPDVHLLIYTRVYPGSTRQDCDVPRYLEFCRHLEETGRIAGPPSYVLHRMLERAQEQHRDVDQRAAREPRLRPMAERLAADVAAIEERIARHQADAAPYVDGEAVTGGVA